MRRAFFSQLSAISTAAWHSGHASNLTRDRLMAEPLRRDVLNNTSQNTQTSQMNKPDNSCFPWFFQHSGNGERKCVERAEEEPPICWSSCSGQVKQLFQSLPGWHRSGGRGHQQPARKVALGV